MKQALFAVAALGALVVAGCGSRSGEPARWPGPPRHSANGRLEVSPFNDFVARKQPALGRSPFAAAAEFLRLDRSRAGTTSLVSRLAGEGGGPAVIVATLDRLPDDSVRAERFVLGLERQGGVWRLRSAVWSQRCWAGRGHQQFSVAPCL